MIPDQQKALQVESLGRSFYEDGFFNEPFIRATIINMDPTEDAELDINGPVPLPAGKIPIVFDCKGSGQNISAIQIKIKKSKLVVVYWTRYAGFQWNQ